MSRGVSRTNTKFKMELSATKDNGESLIFVIESPIPGSTGVLDAPLLFLKICYKLLSKLNEMIKLHIHYLYTEKPGSQFPPVKYAKSTRGRAIFQPKIQVDDLHFYLKFTLPQTPPSHLASKNQPPGSPQIECWNGLICVNVNYTGNII